MGSKASVNLLMVFIAVVGLLLSPSARSAYPDKPVRLLWPTPPAAALIPSPA